MLAAPQPPGEGRPFRFRLLARSGPARLGEITTAHGAIATPVFMPVGTLAAVKSLTVDQLRDLAPEVILCNTYHLMLRPGSELIAALGGVHRFMSWPGTLLSDSGGFQVFSLAASRRITDDAVEFQSHIDGSRHVLSPERSIEIQEQLGVDIMMAFDECPPYGAPRSDVLRAVNRTHAWAQRSHAARLGPAALFGIVQGGVIAELRRTSAGQICALPFDGFAIGGLSVGEPKQEMLDTLRFTAPLLPDEKPRYLMGVGTPEDLVEGVAAGIDMFDCVMPTRNARNGTLFTSEGRLAIRNARYRDDELPLDPLCGCATCRSVSRAYLRHLFVSGEMAAAAYLTVHNLSFYLDLMRRIRQSIASDSFDSFRTAFLARNGKEASSAADVEP